MPQQVWNILLHRAEWLRQNIVLTLVCCLLYPNHSFQDIAHRSATYCVDTRNSVVLVYSLPELRLQGLISSNCVHSQLPLMSVGGCFEHLICCVILTTLQNQVLRFSGWIRKLVETSDVCIHVPQFSICKMGMIIFSDSCGSELISLRKTLKYYTDEY